MATEGHIIHFDKIGSEELGYISVAEYGKQIPFAINRVYWTYHTPVGIERGNHAHTRLHQVVIAVNGTLEISLENKAGQTNTFMLDHPAKGLYVPPGYWRTIRFSEGAVLLCLANELYDEQEYIRDYDSFKNGEP